MVAARWLPTSAPAAAVVCDTLACRSFPGDAHPIILSMLCRRIRTPFQPGSGQASLFVCLCLQNIPQILTCCTVLFKCTHFATNTIMLPHAATCFYMLPWKSIRGNCGPAEMTPSVLTPSGRCQINTSPTRQHNTCICIYIYI